MEKVINGRNYKEVKISKIIVNGKEIEGAVIPAEETVGKNTTTVNIITEDDNENTNEW